MTQAIELQSTTYEVIRLTDLLTWLGFNQTQSGAILDMAEDWFQGDRDTVTAIVPFRALVSYLVPHHEGIRAAVRKLEAEGLDAYALETYPGLPVSPNGPYIRLDLD